MLFILNNKSYLIQSFNFIVSILMFIVRFVRCLEQEILVTLWCSINNLICSVYKTNKHNSIYQTANTDLQNTHSNGFDNFRTFYKFALTILHQRNELS